MQLLENIRTVGTIYPKTKIDLPAVAGIYAFWWVGGKDVLLSGNRQVVLKGPGEKPVAVEYGDWWPEELEFPCLYVGKTTNLRKRFGLHLKNKTRARLHIIAETNEKSKAKTTSCQLRHGIEHVFRNEQDPLTLIHDNVGFSYQDRFSGSSVVERFYTEDRLIGNWRPWFNLDIER